MDKLKVAIMMEDALPTEGGGYSYYQKLLSSLNSYPFHEDIEVIFINIYSGVPREKHYVKPVINANKTFIAGIAYRYLIMMYKFIHRIYKNKRNSYLGFISGLMDAINNKAAKKILTKENVHLIYYLKPRENLIDYPMIVTHWDIGHKSMFPFPEVALNGNFEKRENYYKTILSKAFLILCESETGAKELQNYYAVNPARIKVMPLFAGDIISMKISEEEQLLILSGYKLVKDRFFIYPAQFWAHKNHTTLIDAFHLLRQEPGNESLKLVLCGGDKGNLSYIKNLVNELDLSSNIMIPGFVTNSHLYSFYKNALALVMPTFLGPTNIPLIEAAQLKCAVACSDLKGHKEILESNALYFDPSSATEIRGCMRQILDDAMRKQLVASAYIHIMNSSFQVEKSIPLLDRFLQQVRPIRVAWGATLKLLFAFAKISILSF